MTDAPALSPPALSPPALSIVVPCFDEDACIAPLHARLTTVAQAAVGSDYEIVIVNDGSRDASWDVIAALAAGDPHVVGIDLSRNHGHQLALTAGLDLCRGALIFIVDADLQDPPELLGEMLAVLRDQRAEVVYGVRRARAGETAFKRGTASAFYRLLKAATEVDIPLDAGDFRLMTRRALDVFLAMPESARFVRGMVAWGGFRQVPFPYDRAARLAGETHYPLAKMLRFAFDALTGFSSAPLKLASHAGLLLSAGSLLLIAYIGVRWATGHTIQGWASLMLVMVVLGAVQMFVLGMIGEYLGRLYHQAKGRPLYIVADVIGTPRAGTRLGHRADMPPDQANTQLR
jgi:glycosyltransferase involved in cell wall biosynthesis